MREMKESGVESFGNIPKKWSINRLKIISDVYVGNSIKDEEKHKYEDSIDAIPYIPTKEIDVNTSKVNYENGMYVKNGDKLFKRAKKGSTLMCIEGGSAGKKIAFLDREVTFVNKLCCFKAKMINDKYLYYYLKSDAFKLIFDANISGLIGGVSQNELKAFPICIPPIDKGVTSRIKIFEPIINDLNCAYSKIFFILMMINNNLNMLYEQINFNDKISINTNKKARRHPTAHGKFYSNKKIDTIMLFNTLYYVLLIQKELKRYKNSLHRDSKKKEFYIATKDEKRQIKEKIRLKNTEKI